MRDVGKAAKDWPQINFVIYHSAYRWAGGGRAEQALAQFDQTGRVEWVSDLAEIPEKFGVTNVYGDLGQIFAQTTVVEPRLCAALMGILIKGLGTTMSCGARTRSGPARRNGRSNRCAGSRSPRTCRRSTVSRRSGPPTAR